MKKYHYIDDQGNISDPLPVAALQKIGLPPATKVLIEGGKQWITLAEATAGDPAVVPPPPAPPAPTPPSLKPPTSTTIAATSHSEHKFWKVFLFALFLGLFGGHRFAVGKVKSGLLQLVTFGGLGIWAFIDDVTILLGKFSDSKGLAIPNPNPKTAWAVFGAVILFGIASDGGKIGEKASGVESTNQTEPKRPQAILGDKLSAERWVKNRIESSTGAKVVAFGWFGTSQSPPVMAFAGDMHSPRHGGIVGFNGYVTVRGGEWEMVDFKIER